MELEESKLLGGVHASISIWKAMSVRISHGVICRERVHLVFELNRGGNLHFDRHGGLLLLFFV